MSTHSREHCPGKLVSSFWCPSYCPNGLATATRRLDALVDASEVSWDGGAYATAHYECACCGHRWTEDDWPIVLALGPNWHRRDEPVRLTAGVDVPALTAGQWRERLQQLRAG